MKLAVEKIHFVHLLPLHQQRIPSIATRPHKRVFLVVLRKEEMPDKV